MENTKIAAAFVKAQRSFAPALKTASNPHFRSKYADLSACVEAVLDSLNAEGIALLQVPHESDSGITIETIFLHESGETLSGGRLHVPASKQDAQGYGSACTYARRYGLMAACGIAPEDDDGNAASRRKPDPVKAVEPVKQYAASGAGVKEEAYDTLDDEGRAWVDNLAMEVETGFNDGLKADDLIFHIKEALGKDYDQQFKLALWWKLPSNVRSFIDKQEKGIKDGDTTKAAAKVRAAA